MSKPCKCSLSFRFSNQELFSFAITSCLLHAMNCKVCRMNHRNVSLNIPTRSSIKYPSFHAILRILTGLSIGVLNSVKWSNDYTTGSQNSSLDISASCGLDDQISTHGKGKGFFSSPHRPDGLLGQQAYGKRRIFICGKAAGVRS